MAYQAVLSNVAKDHLSKGINSLLGSAFEMA
jgi:hypothetical protein